MGRILSHWLHNRTVNITEMSVPGSFPRFLQRNPTGKLRPNLYTQGSPLRKPTFWYQGEELMMAAEASSPAPFG